MLPGEWRVSGGGFCSGRGNVCVASGMGIKISWDTWEEEDLGKVVWGLLTPYMHTKFEVSSFSRSGNGGAENAGVEKSGAMTDGEPPV